MAKIRAGLVHQKGVTLLEVDSEKLSIADLKDDAVEQFIELLTSYGTPLPEKTPEGYSVFLDFDRKRCIVCVGNPTPQISEHLPEGWETYEANIYIPDSKKKSTGVYTLGDPPPTAAPTPEDDAAKPGRPTVGGAYVIDELKRLANKHGHGN